MSLDLKSNDKFYEIDFSSFKDMQIMKIKLINLYTLKNLKFLNLIFIRFFLKDLKLSLSTNSKEYYVRQ